jgi:hypothetical protein
MANFGYCWYCNMHHELVPAKCKLGQQLTAAQKDIGIIEGQIQTVLRERNDYINKLVITNDDMIRMRDFALHMANTLGELYDIVASKWGKNGQALVNAARVEKKENARLIAEVDHLQEIVARVKARNILAEEIESGYKKEIVCLKTKINKIVTDLEINKTFMELI